MKMRIALLIENSQADKNPIIFRELNRAATAAGHTVDNYGMYSSHDKRYLTYVMCGMLASVILTTKTADFVVTGCGTGEGACLACNSFPGVHCGHVANPVDAFLFTQINNGNAISLPYAQGYGWGGELNLRFTFEKLFVSPFGGGYPPEKQEVERRNKVILDGVKAVTYRPLPDILHDLDREFVKNAVDDEQFKELFYSRCPDRQIVDFFKSL